MIVIMPYSNYQTPFHFYNDNYYFGGMNGMKDNEV